MKRSQAIKKLSEILSDAKYGRLDVELSTEQLSRKILGEMESLGMLPPVYERMTTTTVFIEDSPIEGHYEDVPFVLSTNEWEKE